MVNATPQLSKARTLKRRFAILDDSNYEAGGKHPRGAEVKENVGQKQSHDGGEKEVRNTPIRGRPRKARLIPEKVMKAEEEPPNENQNVSCKCWLV